MKRRLKDFTVKLFSLILAITMCIPTNVYALADDSEEEMPTIMRLDEDSETDQTEETSDSEGIPTISEEDRNNYDISYDAKLSDSLDSIIYTIKVSKKEESIHDPEKKMTLALATNKNQSLKDLHVDHVRDLEEGDIDYFVDKEEGDLHTFAITTPTVKRGLEYTIKAPIDKDAIDTEKLYSLDMSVDIGDVNIDLRRISYKFMEEASEDNPEEVHLVLTKIKEADDAFQKIAYNKSDEEDKSDTLVYTDYLISKDKQDEASIRERKNEVSYKLILDENQDPATAKISLDYFKANDKGFVLQKEFSTEIAYQEDLTLDVPAGYLLKLTYTNQADKTKTKVENYSVNNRQVKNPRFVKEEEKAEDDEEDPAPAEKTEEQPVEKDSNKQTKENESKDTNTDKKEKKKEEPSKKEEEKAKEPTNLEKADAELKKALADPKNTIKEIQALLDSFEGKYKLDRDAQEKLMTDNDAAIKALVEKDREENFRPNNLAVSNSFADKKFRITAPITLSTVAGPIQTSQKISLKLDDNLTVKSSTQIADLKNTTGSVVAKGSYDSGSNSIIYTFTAPVKENTTLNLDQQVDFNTAKIGNARQVEVQNSLSAPGMISPKNFPKKIVNITDSSPVEGGQIIDQGQSDQVVYPYKLSWMTTSQGLRDYQTGEETQTTENGAYVEWNIEVDTAPLLKSGVNFDNLNVTVFAQSKQGITSLAFNANKDKNVVEGNGGYNYVAADRELISQSMSIKKSDLGDKLYIKVKAPIDTEDVFDTYSIGLRINPDNNYVKDMVDDFIKRYNSIPSIFKWMKGVEEAKQFANAPFNLVETMIPARVGIRDNFTNERFYYDTTRTITADRVTDKRVDWYALDLIRFGETKDDGLENPAFTKNDSESKKDIKPTKVYYKPLKEGGYQRTTYYGDVTMENGEILPGTLISYEYLKQKGDRNDTYNMKATIKQKPVYSLSDPKTSETTGGYIELYQEKVSNADLLTNYVAYLENPYPIMRINKNFDMVQCFNDGLKDPAYEGRGKGIFLDKHENPSGDYLISRLNEKIFTEKEGGHELVPYLKGIGTYDGVNLNPNNVSQGEAMEDLMKRIYYYGEEVKEEYKGEKKEQMHRLIENSMYQRVLHHYTDGTDLTKDFFPVNDNYNQMEWRHNHTLTGQKDSKGGGYTGQFDGKDKTRKTANNLRMLKDKETVIQARPYVKDEQLKYAEKLLEKIIASYKTGNKDWSKEKASTVELVFYSHAEDGKKYQELLTGRVTKPIEIDKYKEDGETKLSGATFTFSNIYTGERVTWTSPEKGQTSKKLYLRPGTWRVEETTPPNGYEKIEPFKIQVKRSEINPDNGPYKFKNFDEIHVHDGFETKLTLKDVPTTSDNKPMVKVEENKDGFGVTKVKVMVKNHPDNLGELKFTKQNNYINLDGAKFSLRKIKDDKIADAKKDINSIGKDDYDPSYNKESTGNSGEFEFKQIPVGYYILEEIEAPKGYDKKGQKYLLEATEEDVKEENGQTKKKVVIKFVGDKKPENTNDKNWIIRNKLKETEIEFRKIRKQEKGYDGEVGLEGAKFRLESIWTLDGRPYYKEMYSNYPKYGGQNPQTTQPSDKGYFRFENIPVGDYRLTEIQPPNGYQKYDHKWILKVREDKDGNLVKTFYKEEKDGKLTELKLNEDGDQVYEIQNEPRKTTAEFDKYIGELERDDEGKVILDKDGKPKVKKELYDKSRHNGEGDRPVSFDLYEADYYGAIVGEKNPDGSYKPVRKNITQNDKGKFVLTDLEFGKYYVLRETNPPKGYTAANDILLKVEAESLASEGRMILTVRDPNANTIFGQKAVFEGVLDYKKGEQLGKFTIKKTGRAIDYIDENGNLVKVNDENSINVGLRRAYFRLYTADKNFNIKYKDPNKQFAEDYIQKVSPGNPIIGYLTEDQAKKLSQEDRDYLGVAKYENSYALDKDGKKIRIGKDPNKLPENQGIVTFDNLKPGNYVLEEYRGPAGYEKTTDKWYIKVDDNGNVIKSKSKDDTSFTSPTVSTRNAVLNQVTPNLDLSPENLRSNVLRQAAKPLPAGQRLDSETYTVENDDAKVTVNANLPLRQSVNDPVFKEFTKTYQDITENLDITVNAKQVDKATGEREINLSISPKEVQGKVPTNVQMVFMIDRARDYSIDNKFAEGRTLDKNINKIITDIAKKAKENNTNIDVTFIEYNNKGNAIKGTPNQSLTDLYDKIPTSTYNMKDAGTTQVSETEYNDFINKVGIKSRNTSNDDSSESLYKNIDTYLGSINNNEQYDKKILVDFTNFLSTGAEKNKKTGNYYKKDIINKFADFESYVRHVDQRKNTYSDYVTNMKSDHSIDFDLHGDENGRNTQAQFVHKSLLNKLLKDEYYFKEGTNSVANARLDLILNEDIKLIDKNANIGSTSLSPVVDESTGKTSIKLDNINLKAGEKLDLTYKIGIKNPTLDQTYPINDSITLTDGNNISNIPTTGLVTIKESNPTPDPQPQGDVNLEVNFTYSNSTDGKADTNVPTAPAPGKLILEEVNGGSTTPLETQEAVYQGKVQFNTKLDKAKSYRVRYQRTDDAAKDWALPRETIYNIPRKSLAGKDTVSLTIENGNTLEIFNKDETGFRIPLRVTKVNESKGLLTGSQFKARKLLNGDQEVDGKHPKYYDEEFDAVSEATGLPGDNYFRELSPGIYELYEIKTPDESYRFPTDEEGNLKKWYFEVKIDENKKPSDDNYMTINFKFDKTLPTDVNDPLWNSGISKDEREKLAGKKIKGIDFGYIGDKQVYDKFTEIIPDDGRSDPARPDAPYKGIKDVRVTNYKNNTDLKFYKKDSSTNANIAGAVFSLERAKLDDNGKIKFGTDKEPQTENFEEQETIKDEYGNETTRDKFVKPKPYNKEEKYAQTKATKSGVVDFSNIEAGTYILRERQPAPGYKPIEDAFLAVKFSTGEDGKWKKEVKAYKKDKNGVYQEVDASNPSSFFRKDSKGGLESVLNDKNFIDFSFTKIDARDDSEIKSTDFKLTKVDENTGKEDLSFKPQYRYSYDKSKFTFTNLDIGYYKLEEIRVLTDFNKPEPWYFWVKEDEDTGKLKIVFKDKDESVRFTPVDPKDNTDKAKAEAEATPDLTKEDIKVKNYRKTNFIFKKQNQDGEALSNVGFSLTKLRNSMDGEEYKYDIDGKSEATQAYYSKARSEFTGQVRFDNLTEGIYELVETDKPEGYESEKNQDRWIIQVVKGAKGLEVKYDADFEKKYYAKYDSDYAKKLATGKFATSLEKAKSENSYSYTLTNTKSTTDLKWQKVKFNNKTNGFDVIESYTRFRLYKTSNDPKDLDSAKSGQATTAAYVLAETDGIFEAKDLSKGVYVLVEEHAPDGFKLMDRKIIIRIYEDNEGVLQKQFYEMDGDQRIDTPTDFTYLFTDDGNTDINFYVKNNPTDSFFFSKGYLGGKEGKDYKPITSGKLQLTLYPTDDKDKKKYETYTKEFDLEADQDSSVTDPAYKFDVEGIREQLIKDKRSEITYTLEETSAPDGFTKTTNKYKIKFVVSGEKLITKLIAVNVNGKDVYETDTGDPIPTIDSDKGINIFDGENANNKLLKIVNKKTEIEFTKVGKEGSKEEDLEGVTFHLEKQEEDGTDYHPVKEDMTFTENNSIEGSYKVQSNEDGKFKFQGLTDGNYGVVEDETVKGYITPKDPVKTFKVRHGEITEIDGTEVNGNVDEIKSKIYNFKPVYPSTGGPGTWIGYTLLGTLIMSLGGAYIALKKKESIKA